MDNYKPGEVAMVGDIVDRLRGKYPVGPHLPNGDPEFGWRQFEATPINSEAATEIEYLRAENERLSLLADGKLKEAVDAARLMHAGPDGKGFTFDIQCSIVPLLAYHLEEAFDGLGGENNVSIEVNTDKHGPMEIIMQRRWGKTLAQQNRELRERIQELEGELPPKLSIDATENQGNP